MRTRTLGALAALLLLGACKDGGSGSSASCAKAEDCAAGARCVNHACVGDPKPTTPAADADAEARLVGTWWVDWPALSATPTMQRKTEEARRQSEANSKQESYAFHADHTVDVTVPSPKPAEHGTWHVSSNHGELGLQILQGNGKGNNNFESTLVFNGPDHVRMTIPSVGFELPLVKK